MPISEDDLVDGSELPSALAWASGTSLVPVFDPDGSREGGVTVARIGELAAPTANVRTFGAMGDGTTNDHAAIQNAINSGLGRVYFPAGNYAINDGIALPSNIEVFGDGAASRITSTGTNRRVFFAANQVNVVVRDLFINGNLTGAGAPTTPGSAGGDGVMFLTCNDVAVENCIFNNIGQAGYVGSTACIGLFQTNRAKIIGNRFLENNSSRVGADISFGYYCSSFVISGNISRSEHDAFISGSGVGLTESDTAHHVITGNIGVRASGSGARSGIILPYDSRPAFSSIADNVLVNFARMGIYVGAGATPVGLTNSAAVTVTGNVVRYCGGDNAPNQVAGIYLSGTGGVTCSGNLVVRSGYNSSGAPRAITSPGIYVGNTSRNITISGNNVTGSRSHGVSITNVSPLNLESIIVTGNILFDNEGGGILVSANGAGSVVKDILIASNSIKFDAVSANGIFLQVTSGATLPGPIRIHGNDILVTPGSSSSGITTNAANVQNWIIKDNNIKGFNYGILLSNGAGPDKEFGYRCVISGNTLDTCEFGIGASLGTGKYALVYDSTFRNCTTNLLSPLRVLNAIKRAGQVVDVYRSTPPTDGDWIVGQRVVRDPPVVGQPKSWVCTVAGSPGTWVSEGNL